jgi:ATP-dependent Zn protease
MASDHVTPGLLDRASASSELGAEWRRLTRAATVIAVITSPAPFFWFHTGQGWGIGWSLVATFLTVIAFRGLVDLMTRRMLPWPSLYGTDDADLKEEDVVNRRRASFWRYWLRVAVFFGTVLTAIWLIRLAVPGGTTDWIDSSTGLWTGTKKYAQQNLYLLFGLPVFFLFNFLILLGPMMMIGITQMRGFEPGDADWGVRLEDVRGQDEAKAEVSRVVSLWQSGEAFEKAGGKRERGLLFLGAPGTGKTMLAKAIATGFNCFGADVEFMTRDGLKSFAETAGTVQIVLNREGDWVPAEIRSFGTQPLVNVELRPGLHTRSSIRVHVQATPDHRWVTENRGVVSDLIEGDLVPFRGAVAETRDLGAFIRGFGFGDGTLDARGRARIRLCGEKDREHLPLFEDYGHCFVSYPPSYGGDPLVCFNGGHMSNWKTLPTGDEGPEWLASWLEGYLAADGWSSSDGARVLETQDADAVPFVKRIAPYAGYMVVGNHTKSSTVTNYGRRSSPLVALKLRREGFWKVLSVNQVAGRSEVYCAVEPKTGTFTLAAGVLTGNCPFVSMPGSGFQQTFMGMDAVIVRYLARKAKKLARKWGGQCIVFIDEIDAVGMRRSALGGAPGGTHSGTQFADYLFYGPQGALNPSGDMILETSAWRERLFRERDGSPPAKPGRLAAIVNQGGVFPGMMGGGGGQLALNQLLVVMDGIDNPPFFRRLFTNWVNTFLDATYVIPLRVGRVGLRMPRPRPRKDQIYFIGATNVPIDSLDPALTRPGRMGRHVWLRTPTKHDRADIFDLYIDKVSHEPDLDTEKRRDELARITSGYSPAMIEQVCSMALTLAHSDRRERFNYEDIFEAMTTVESGTAINIEYGPDETRAVAIHEAGHAAASHVFMKDAQSTRISIRMRGGSLGHHQTAEQVERFSQWRSDQMAILIWGLGAMAAERVFYGQTSSGVGGDLSSATFIAALMVGAAGMGPEPLDLDERLDAKEEARVLKRFEDVGLQLMSRTGGGGPFAHDPVASVLSDRDKRKTAAQILGQAYVTAHNLMLHNRGGIEHIADQVVARREIYGDELLELLDESKLKAPRIDLLEEASWPML